MEGKDRKVNGLNNLEFEVIDQLYLIIPYAALRSKIGAGLDEALTGLLRKKYVKQLQTGGPSGYEEKFDPDLEKLDGYHYLATKQGMMVQNGMV